jgi:7-cyano-7-deazaguanine synthase in queuosine biosynthesis
MTAPTPPAPAPDTSTAPVTTGAQAPDTSNYPPCSSAVHDRCVQTHELARQAGVATGHHGMARHHAKAHHHHAAKHHHRKHK